MRGGSNAGTERAAACGAGCDQGGPVPLFLHDWGVWVCVWKSPSSAKIVPVPRRQVCRSVTLRAEHLSGTYWDKKLLEAAQLSKPLLSPSGKKYGRCGLPGRVPG